ncbi:unnamed protein product [Rotaria sordida]|uniref:Uncharacterized protein n=1 Tax=Rotaria sordida TaxID=392033 RepID=A0A815PJ32_9BILA|nr:unnamed protein product [Rotaria sordida]CAF1449430.1 unnamed protein product [Rotaria sordida]
MLVLYLRKRINANCGIEIVAVVNDIETLKKFNADLYIDKDLFLAHIEALFALHIQNTIASIQQALEHRQNKNLHHFHETTDDSDLEVIYRKFEINRHQVHLWTKAELSIDEKSENFVLIHKDFIFYIT